MAYKHKGTTVVVYHVSFTLFFRYQKWYFILFVLFLAFTVLNIITVCFSCLLELVDKHYVCVHVFGNFFSCLQ